MRNKKAKALRKLAESKTVGMPKVDYKIIDHKSALKPTLKPQIKMINKCTRKVYKDLKKEF